MWWQGSVLSTKLSSNLPKILENTGVLSVDSSCLSGALLPTGLGAIPSCGLAHPVSISILGLPSLMAMQHSEMPSLLSKDTQQLGRLHPSWGSWQRSKLRSSLCPTDQAATLPGGRGALLLSTPSPHVAGSRNVWKHS